MESFTESLNRLKEVHENEVRGLQNKLLELNSERCRDAQRVEELCAKNHQLREQQKALKENVRVLENRLRAGLCDRCMVTQELARKKHQEFENSLLQNLQHVFILTNELNRLQLENETLKEEVKRLRGPRLKPQYREGASDPPSPLLLPSPGAWKAIAEKTLGGHEEAEDDHPEKSTGYRTSPVAKISPSASLPETRAPDTSPQRISNQLHGTIAVVRPGSQACFADRGSSNGTPPLPLTRSSPPSPPYEHSLPLDSFLRASRPPATAYESLKRSLQADHLCLLNHHLSLHLQSPHCSPQVPATAPRGPRPQGPKAGEAEAWDEPVGLLGLPGALVDVQDPRLKGALHLLLAQQLRAQGQVGSARLRGPPTPAGTPPSPPVSSDSEGPQGEAAGAALSGGGHTQPTGPGSPRGQEDRATRDYVPDKPLDLSERGRGRHAPKPPGRLGSLSPPSAHTPSLAPPQGVELPARSGPWGLSNGTKEARAPEPEGPAAPADPSQPLTRPHPNMPSPSGTGAEGRGKPKSPPNPHRPDADGPPELSKAQVQGLESDELDELDPSDNEVGLSSEVGAKPSTPGEGSRCSCTKECGRGLLQKRKRPSGPWCKAPKKPPPARRNPGEPLTAHEGSGSPRHPEDSSPSPSNSSWEET
ncbi:RBBP8 N-terminal-like protein isoform X2 [Leptonychotes weddellii]|uniref:RBBP8 N-terminal-like protein isoform X2 n=1 Tax=Leptonychotes weddellii TaxID=9713 RepID=A0A7F8Q8A4_LEPWE|nr:RBBP8 N-terminal-like protein isoform X2 [Leptonychotes weddellii]